MTERLPEAPNGRIEHDFLQTPVRLTARAAGNGYEIYMKDNYGGEKVLFASESWPDTYLCGNSLAEIERQAPGIQAVGKMFRMIQGGKP